MAKETSPFQNHPDKIVVLLVPYDANEREQVENLLSTHAGSVPSRVSYDLKLQKLGPQHVVYAAVTLPAKLNHKKQVTDRKLVVSPPIPVEKFVAGFEGDIQVGRFVDTVQEYVRPFRCAISVDQQLKLING